VLLDIIFNHTGDNFFYKQDGKMKSTLPYKDKAYPFGAWKDEHGKRNHQYPGLAQRTAHTCVHATKL
jgi:glycosidase